MSPELLGPPRFGSNGLPTPESDCYALGMVVYEVPGLRGELRLQAGDICPAWWRR
ncbi:hypothetical protein BDM02DRAFT_3113395 [Thelephora ganbajun]|uniref:Uncharacterized protein n=1 Tax=Thelephora ganbajun TaxID=370292 RepID=A0ACB6ZJI2_THEGA|nr:hypothetical protein BDM02DRAFT_3113395 [Thelephora ganbajun]